MQQQGAVGCLAWGDELCGVEVTPESWVGGVYEQDGRWYLLDSLDGQESFGYGFFTTDYYGSQVPMDEAERAKKITATRPIFPPRNFRGLSDAELWDAVVGRVEWKFPLIEDNTVSLASDLSLGIYGPHGVCDSAAFDSATNIGGLLTALQNAQVLAQRLTPPAGGAV
jgi:hypothetical protein